MNKFAKSWVSSIFLGGLALSFGIWGIADVFRGGSGSDNTVATVGGVEITSEAFQSEYNRRISAMRRQGDITPELARAMGLPQTTLKQLIGSAALQNTGDRLGVAASDDQIRSAIQQQTAFRNATGQYDYNVFLQRLQSAGYSEREYIDAVRRDMMAQQLSAAVQSDFELPLGYAHTLYDFLNQTRAAEYVVVTPDAIGSIATPSDDVLSEYLNKNVDRFSTPEYRSVTYAMITPDDVIDQVEVPEDQLDKIYEANKASYSTPEKRDIQQITYPDEAAAKAARAKIAAGQSFVAAAEERGLKPNDIELGELVAADLSGEKGTAAFSLSQGAVSEPIRDTFGWVLLRANKIIPGTSRDADEVKAELRKQYALSLANAKIDDIVNAFQDARAAGDDIPTAADKVGMHGGKIENMDSNGLLPDGSPSSAPKDSDFLNQVASAEAGVDPDPVRTMSGAAYVVKVDGIVPPEPRPLADVRKEVLAAWLAEEKASRLKAKADELADLAKKDNSLSAVASQLHASIRKTPGLKRGTTDQAPLSAPLIAQIFEQPAGGIAVGPLSGSEGYVIAKVTGIAHSKPADDAPEFTAMREQASNQAATDLPDQLIGEEIGKSKVSTNQAVLDQIVGEGQ